MSKFETTRIVAIAAVCVASVALPGSAQAFNPQPDPPGISARPVYPVVTPMHNPPGFMPAVVIANRP